jgi:hypothetical protein
MTKAMNFESDKDEIARAPQRRRPPHRPAEVESLL